MSRLQSWKFAVVSLLICASRVWSDEVYTPVVNPISPGLIDKVPGVDRVPGKEFTDIVDFDYVPTPHSPLAMQLGLFDGVGGAKNGVNAGPFAPTALSNFNVDAQAGLRDELFWEVANNQVPLIFSLQGDTMMGGGVALGAERADGVREIFATSQQVHNHAHVGGTPRDVDSVELWGTEGKTGSNYLSVKGDPLGTSIYSMHLLAPGGVQPYLSQTEIALAIGQTNLAHLIDVDGLMVYDIGTGLNPFDGNFGPGDAILFSIAPILNVAGGPLFDGGEIWLWKHGDPNAQFLNHGGHVWNTAFDVRGTFGGDFENLDGLEAASIPEPGTLGLAMLTVIGAAWGRRWR